MVAWGCVEELPNASATHPHLRPHPCLAAALYSTDNVLSSTPPFLTHAEVVLDILIVSKPSQQATLDFYQSQQGEVSCVESPCARVAGPAPCCCSLFRLGLHMASSCLPVRRQIGKDGTFNEPISYAPSHAVSSSDLQF